jgi:hypothetical protein
MVMKPQMAAARRARAAGRITGLERVEISQFFVFVFIEQDIERLPKMHRVCQ